MTPPARYRCHACAATFTAWAPAERHADSEHHPRIEVLIPIDERSPMSPTKRLAKDRKDGQRRMGTPKPNTITATQPAEPKQAGRRTA